MRQKTGTALWLVTLLIGGAASASAQQPTGDIKDAMPRLAARMDTLERGGCPTGPAIIAQGKDSLSQSLGQLSARLEKLINARCQPGAVPAQPAADSGGDDL